MFISVVVLLKHFNDCLFVHCVSCSLNAAFQHYCCYAHMNLKCQARNLKSNRHLTVHRTQNRDGRRFSKNHLIQDLFQRRSWYREFPFKTKGCHCHTRVVYSTLNFGKPQVMVFQLEVYNKVDRLLTSLTAQQKGTTARWYSRS